MRQRRVAGVLVAAILIMTGAGCSVIERGTGTPVTKVVVFGSSIMDFAFPEISAKFATYGVTVHYAGAPSTGPLWNQKQWAAQLTAELEAFHPQIVIFEACCSYPGGKPEGANYVNGSGVEVLPDTELMFQEWEQAERELIAITRAAGASPWWTKVPPGTEASRFYALLMPERMARFNTIVDTLGVPIVDWGTAVMSAPNVDELRWGDGVHYTQAGDAFIANVAFTTTVKLST